jgi:DNA helicase-2/ATP-dependent DNA helicase PcrA
MRNAKTTWPAEFALVRQWYEPHLHRMYDDGQLRMADITSWSRSPVGMNQESGF